MITIISLKGDDPDKEELLNVLAKFGKAHIISQEEVFETHTLPDVSTSNVFREHIKGAWGVQTLIRWITSDKATLIKGKRGILIRIQSGIVHIYASERYASLSLQAFEKAITGLAGYVDSSLNLLMNPKTSEELNYSFLHGPIEVTRETAQFLMNWDGTDPGLKLKGDQKPPYFFNARGQFSAKKVMTLLTQGFTVFNDRNATFLSVSENTVYIYLKRKYQETGHYVVVTREQFEQIFAQPIGSTFRDRLVYILKNGDLMFTEQRSLSEVVAEKPFEFTRKDVNP